MGTYGFIRIALPLFPAAAQTYSIYIAILAVISIIYGAMVAMAQKDMKKLIAYSSVNHMGYVMLGIAAACAVDGSITDKTMALSGAVLQMFSHGLITGALFLLVGVIYERTHNRDLGQFGGLGAKVPIYAGLLSFASFASLGLPGLAGFVSEFFIFRGAFGINQQFTIITALAGIGIVLNAAYLLWMIQRVALGPLNPKWADIRDVDTREVVSLVPLMVLTILIGVLPAFLLNTMNISLIQVVRAVAGGG